MRLVKEVPHQKFKIQIFQYNGKYITKIELGQFEQSFKIGETDVFGVSDVEAMLTTEFLNKTIKRFVEMREDWGIAFNQKNLKNE